MRSESVPTQEVALLHPEYDFMAVDVHPGPGTGVLSPNRSSPRPPQYCTAAPEPWPAPSRWTRRWVERAEVRLHRVRWALRRVDFAHLTASLCVVLTGFSTGWVLRQAGPAGFVVMMVLLAILAAVFVLGRRRAYSLRGRRLRA